MEEKWEARWIGGGQFIELEIVQSTEHSRGALIVASSLPFNELPIGFNEQIPLTAESKCCGTQKGC